MDPEQVRAEMKAARERIDRKLDHLEKRAKRAKRPAKIAAFAAGALASGLFLMVKRRKARKRAQAARHA